MKSNAKGAFLILLIFPVLGLTIWVGSIWVGSIFDSSSSLKYEESGAQYRTLVITNAGNWEYKTVKPITMNWHPSGFNIMVGSQKDYYPNEGVIRISKTKIEK